jgi:hypothetical protein
MQRRAPVLFVLGLFSIPLRRFIVPLVLVAGFVPLGRLSVEAQKQPAGIAVPAVPGYERRVIEGFTLLISKEVLENNTTASYERKPLEVLELELKTIVAVMNPKSLELLRRLLIWVDWDEQQELSSGRPGFAVAVYYGGHQLSMLQKGRHPLRARCVSILRMKRLTEEHQPKRELGRCVILHEIAHAVHDQLLGGNNNLQIKSAFQQAMERKLYDRTAYVSTNEQEFFAELTCAYLNQLHYYPRNREDLKKHDPATFKLMASIWGQPKEAKTAKGTKATPGSQLYPDVTLDKVKWGKTLMGPPVGPEEVRDRVVLLVCLSMQDRSSLTCLPKLSPWHIELSEFGLVTAAAHMPKTEPSEVIAAARSRDVPFSVLTQTFAEPRVEGKDMPLAYVFDHTGACIYRGSAFGVESELRAAVGRALVAATGEVAFSKYMTPHVEALRQGKSPTGVLQKIVPMQKSPDAETAVEAKLLVQQITAIGQKRLEDAEARLKNDPVEAFLQLERVPTVFKTTTLAAQADKFLTALKKDKAVAAELKARPLLEQIKKLDTSLSSKPGAFDPKLPKFQQANQASITQMRTALLQMTKAWPTTRATQEAARISEKYGISAR